MIAVRLRDPAAWFRRAARAAIAALDRADARLPVPEAERERGAISVEFVLLVPAVIAIFISSFEGSILLARQVMLERALDLVVRDIRLDTGNTVSQGQVRSQLCANARILPDCQQNMLIEMTRIDQSNYATPASDAPCVNQLTSVVPPARWENDRAGKMILIRACYSMEPSLPLRVLASAPTLGANLVADEDGAIRIVTASAFVVEQNVGVE